MKIIYNTYYESWELCVSGSYSVNIYQHNKKCIVWDNKLLNLIS